MANKPDFKIPFNDLTQYVPQNLRNPVLSSLIDNLFNRFMTHDESVPFYGYVGSKSTNPDDRAFRIPQANPERDINAVIPVFSFKLGSEQVVFTAEDIINKAKTLGVSPNSLHWLYSEGHNYLPPIDLDKFTNFFNYYWVGDLLPTAPDMPWNPELLPEYYTIAAPLDTDLTKLNVVTASTSGVVLTGTGFYDQSFIVKFLDADTFTITPTGSLGAYTPVTDTFVLTSNNQHIDYVVTSPTAGTLTLLSFDVIRDPIYGENPSDPSGPSIIVGYGSFEADDTFTINPVFLSRNYTMSFTGSAGVKGKISSIRPLSVYQTVGGVQVNEGDRVLIKNNMASENGIYVVGPQDWTRASDFSTSTAAAGAKVFVKNGTLANSIWESISAGSGYGWVLVASNTTSNTNDWQEGNFWVKGTELGDLGLTRTEAIQAVRPIIEYAADVQLNQYVANGIPSDSGTSFRQSKTEFNQLPLFDLYRYDGTHAGLVSSVFFYVEDLTADLDVSLQKRVAFADDTSSDFLFNHGMVDADGALLFVKRGSDLKTIWGLGHTGPSVSISDDVVYTGTGNGTITALAGIGYTQPQTWTLTAISATQFQVSGSLMAVLPDSVKYVTVGTPYTNGQFSITISVGSTAFEIGDTFTFRIGNVESAAYVYRDSTDQALYELYGEEDADVDGIGAWQVPKMFYYNPYNASADSIAEGTLYSHFRGILTSQLTGKPIDYKFGGSIKLWSEQISLLSALLMQRDLTPISMIDLAQRQYETGLNAIADIYQQNKNSLGQITTPQQVEVALTEILKIRAVDNDVRTVLYDSTSPVIGFPPTLPMLGISPLVQPAIAFDSELGVTLLTHHDGHKSPLSGDDKLDRIMLLVETKLYQGISDRSRKFDFAALAGSTDFNSQLEKELFTYAQINGYDPLAPDYVSTDAFTWNYSQGAVGNFPALNSSSVPARWFDVLKSHQSTVANVIQTDRPNLEPWKLFNYADYATWWAALTPTKRAAYTPFIDISNLSSANNRGAVRVVQTQNIVSPLTGLYVIDGVQLVAGDRVLLQNELSSTSNGVWVASASTWTRVSMPQNGYVTVTSGTAYSGTTWVLSTAVSNPLTDPALFKQARIWTNELWADVKLARPGLRLSVDTVRDNLLPPYVSSANPQSINALTTVIPAGISASYQFGQNSPVETVWKKSIEYGYSLARALFRYDPLAFLGFCWGFNWVEVDGILYDGFDINMPGHQRFRLHGDAISQVNRAVPTITGSGVDITATYDAYDTDRKQCFTIRNADGAQIGFVQEGVQSTVAGWTILIEDSGKPFRMGDKYTIGAGGFSFTPATTYIYNGFGQVFTHALRQVSIDTTSGYAVQAYRGWDVNMGHRAGGLVSTENLRVTTDTKELAGGAYQLVFKKNLISQDAWVQALRVSVQSIGANIPADVGFVPSSDGSDWVFRIEGYNPRKLDLKAYELDTNSALVDFKALSGAHTNLDWYQPTEVLDTADFNLPFNITGIQNVVNFMFGYQRYLEDQGWEFNVASEYSTDAQTGRTRNWQLEIEKFIDACYSGIQVDQGHVMNPFMDKLWVNHESGLLSQFNDTALFDATAHPAVFDAMGVKFNSKDLTVLRTNKQSEVSAIAPMFSAHVQLDEFEHLFIFNNYAEPSTKTYTLYHPFSGARAITYKFNGRRQTGDTMRPDFGGYFLAGDKVIQNIQGSTDNLAKLYDANSAFDNHLTSRHALALLGFNSKSYFDDIDISDKTQFNFWRGLIQAKGTNLSIDAYLNNDRFSDARIDEYWAYKVAEYGDARQKTYPELKLQVVDTLQQFTQLQFDAQDDIVLDDFIQISRFDESRWFSIDDMDQDAYFKAEVVGTYTRDFTADDLAVTNLYTLPFIADKLVITGPASKVNANTILVASAGTVSITGYGPATPKYNPIKLFNYVAEELVAEIPLWDPARGAHTPEALEEINIISSQNPAKYNYSSQVVGNNTYDPLRPWGTKEVGRTWLNTKNLSYLPYYDATVFPGAAERLSRWGTLADYASIDLYEWVQSSVPPSEYDAQSAIDSANADLDAATKASGQVALQETFVRNRNWFMRPIAWSHAGVPTPEAHEPPGAFKREGLGTLYISGGTCWLESGTFAAADFSAGDTIGTFNFDPLVMKPLSEGTIQATGSQVLTIDGTVTNTAEVLDAQLADVHVDFPGVPFSGTINLTPTGTSVFTGELLFTGIVDSQRVYSSDGTALDEWDYSFSIRVTEVGSGDTRSVLLSTVRGSIGSLQTPSYGTTDRYAPIAVTTGETFTYDLGDLGLALTVTSTTTGDVDGGFVLAGLESLNGVSGARVKTHDSVTVDWSISPENGSYTNSSDGTGTGWCGWDIPTQAELDADTRQPYSSWKPYPGDAVAISPATGAVIAQAVAEVESPLTLNDGTEYRRFSSTWSEWQLLQDVILTAVNATGSINSLTLTHTENFSASRTSVYVDGIAQLAAAYSFSGKDITIAAVRPGSTVRVVVRQYAPTATELAFDPDAEDDPSFQQHYKQDYEYASQPVRDSEGSISSYVYFFWVKNKTTPAASKKTSIQGVTNMLRAGPDNYLTFQYKVTDVEGQVNANLIGSGSTSDPYRYDSISISGLSYVVTKDDTFKLRFTRNFTLRDDPDGIDLKDTHTEWSLIRPGQTKKIPEQLWQKLVDSMAGEDAAGNSVPALRRVLYDERNGTKTQFGFGDEQTLAPATLLRSSVSYTIVNTKLVDTDGVNTVPDHISFLGMDESDTWFLTAASTRKVMTDIWNEAKITQINEIFFAALDDILASSYELTDIFKTSRLSAYSIKVLRQ